MSGATQDAKLAIITVTHDSGHILPAWIDSLEAIPERDLLELCVVDSGSSLSQLALMKEQASGRVDRFLALPNVGYGSACNAGADSTPAPVLLFTNPDIRIRSLPVRALNGDGLADGLFGAFAVAPHRSLGFAQLPRWTDEARKLLLGRWAGGYERCAISPAWVSGAALLIGRESFERIGGFSPAFFMYFEDADLCARHRCAGGKVELDDGFVVHHGSGKSVDEGLQGSLPAALDAVSRLSSRGFAARYGRPWHRPVLFALLALVYAPRRFLSLLVRDRQSLRSGIDSVACLLWPRRALRELNAQHYDAPDRKPSSGPPLYGFHRAT
jgi:N-acetylglucosaminyl-diphospho-decaprenol L-rhamnosyltransferase